MPIVVDRNEYGDDLEVALRLQDILLQAAEGARGGQLDQEYRELRRALLADDTYDRMVPKLVRRNRDLASLWPALKSLSPQWEPRRQEIRKQFDPLLSEAERTALFDSLGRSDQGAPAIANNPHYSASAWTGAGTPSERIVAVKTLLPVAQGAVEQLLASLDAPSHNGGPKLDEVEEAIRDLRRLHGALGELLLAADEGRLADAFNGGLATEVSRYAKRAARALRDDPIPYTVAATILAILTACGLPGIGGFLSGVAVNMRKRGA